MYHRQTISYDQAQAALTFTNDFERAQIHSLRAIDISNILKKSMPNKQYTLSDAKLDAQDAFNQALNEIPEKICKYILMQFCCNDVPLSHLDQQLGWRKGKASTHLKGALNLLSNHYNKSLKPS